MAQVYSSSLILEPSLTPRLTLLLIQYSLSARPQLHRHGEEQRYASHLCCLFLLLDSQRAWGSFWWVGGSMQSLEHHPPGPADIMSNELWVWRWMTSATREFPKEKRSLTESPRNWPCRLEESRNYKTAHLIWT